MHSIIRSVKKLAGTNIQLILLKIVAIHEGLDG